MVPVSLVSYPAIDPVLVEFGPLAIRWYALAYLAGIILGYFYLKRINASMRPSLLTPKQLDDLIVWAVLGIMLGGRLGYVFFYKPDYYLSHPEDIIAVWQGGMAFHGGLVGVAIAFAIFAHRAKIAYLPLMDQIACAAPIGLFFGRLANFINGELYGRISDCALCMIFPRGGPLPRHPSQLYEALLEGALLFALLYVLWRHTVLARRPGALAGVFLVGYGLARSLAEYFREPDAHLGFIFSGLTMGQLLCLPMIILGIYLIGKRKPSYEPASHH